MRRSLPLVLCLFVLAAFSPGPAFAHGPALRGTEIDRTTPIKGILRVMKAPGSPRRIWHTVGLLPGKSTIQLTINSCSVTLINVPCAANIWILQGDTQIQQIQVVCTAPRKGCGQTVTSAHTTKTRGVYYLLITGQGTDELIYTFRINNIYRLNCKKFC